MDMKTLSATNLKLMNNVLSGIIGMKCLIYMNGIREKKLYDHNNKSEESVECLFLCFFKNP